MCYLKGLTKWGVNVCVRARVCVCVSVCLYVGVLVSVHDIIECMFCVCL